MPTRGCTSRLASLASVQVVVCASGFLIAFSIA